MRPNLIQKYNVPCPRYTSYPTVPYWEEDQFTYSNYRATLKQSFLQSNATEGISLYIHLPFCESLCTFCGCNKRITKQHQVETPYIEAVLKEWDLYCDILQDKPNIKEIHLGGGTPTFFSVANLEKLISGILSKAHKMPDYEFSFEGHPNNTTYEHLKTLYHLGFTRVSFGVQDYSLTVQKAINRIQPFENVERVTQWAREIGYTSISHDLVFGLPFQTTQDIIDTIEKTITLQPDRLAFYSYAHVPWIKGNGQRGFKDEDVPKDQEKRQMYEIGKSLLQERGYLEIGMDHFALKSDSLYKAFSQEAMHRNFMGYSASKTQLMIGLGVSSIGDSWYGFGQNVKDIETYYQILDSDTLPITRGHILTDKDLVIRKHILDLMCHFHTQWNETELPEIHAILKRLEEMQNDGLIELSDHCIRVTPQGKPFVRNICMAFDLRLHERIPESRIFSMAI